MTCTEPTATTTPIVQTVIRWRRPSDLDSLRDDANNPCGHILGNALCYIVSGTLLLVVGVIITSLSFQNLDHSGESERYAGPVLIAGGVLVMARGALSRLWPRRQTMDARRRSLLRRYVQQIYSRPIFALDNTSTFSLCDRGESSGLCHPSRRSRLYSDEPPSYDVVTSAEYNAYHNHAHYDDVLDNAYHSPASFDVIDSDTFNVYQNPAFLHAFVNPTSYIDDENTNNDTSDDIMISQNRSPQRTSLNTSVEAIQGDVRQEPEPPPSYEEYIKSASMKTTKL